MPHGDEACKCMSVSSSTFKLRENQEKKRNKKIHRTYRWLSLANLPFYLSQSDTDKVGAVEKKSPLPTEGVPCRPKSQKPRKIGKKKKKSGASGAMSIKVFLIPAVLP